MTEHGEHWKTLDFELFHDQQLDSDRVPKLSEALRKDAALRTRLAQVRRIDEALRTALLQPRRTESFLNIISRRTAFALVSVVFAVSASIWLTQPRMTRMTVTRGTPAPIAGDPEYRSVRVVLTLPVPPSDGRTPFHQGDGRKLTSGKDEKVFLSRLDDTVAAGQFEQVHRLIASVPPDRRRAGLRHLGDLLRSAEVAESVLDEFSPEEQLTVCGQWASVTTIRPVVFARLRHLAQESSLTTEVHQMLAELSRDPALRAWIQGYQLILRS